MNEYNQQAADFLQTSDTLYNARMIGVEWDDCGKSKLPRFKYIVTLRSKGRTFKTEYTGSMADAVLILTGKPIPPVWTVHERTALKERFEQVSLWILQSMKVGFLSYESKALFCRVSAGLPTAYDVLTCLQKYPAESHADWCSEMGYDVDSIAGLKVYEACRDEYLKLATLYNETEMDLLREIQ